MKENVDKRKSKKSRKTRMAAENAASKKEYKRKKNGNSKKTLNPVIPKIIITVLGLIIAIVLVVTSDVFKVSEIIVEGNKVISDAQIISYSGVQIGTNIFSITKSDIASKLNENSYIEDVIIKRVLPDKLELTVEERGIKYALRLANSFVYINEKGYILEISENIPTVPIIFGNSTDLTNLKENDRLEESDLNKLNMVVKIMKTAENNDMENLITQIDISDEKNYAVYLDTEGKVAYLGDGNELNTRFLYIKKILGAQQGKKGEIFVNVNLNSEYVYFRENI